MKITNVRKMPYSLYIQQFVWWEKSSCIIQVIR